MHHSKQQFILDFCEMLKIQLEEFICEIKVLLDYASHQFQLFIQSK